jgi:hypothetical protein
VLLPLLVLVSSCSTVSMPSAPAAELAGIRAVLPGTYSGPSTAPWDPTQSITLEHVFAEITAPQFGELVYYYQLSVDGKVMQQKLFSFDTNPARTGNSMQPHVIPPGTVAGDFHARPGDWSTLAVTAVNTFPPACALRWETGTAGDWTYSARSLPRDCRFASARFNDTIKGYIRYDISATGLRWAERLVTTGGKLVAQTAKPLVAGRR